MLPTVLHQPTALLKHNQASLNIIIAFVFFAILALQTLKVKTFLKIIFLKAKVHFDMQFFQTGYQLN